mgnify:CR=1 FL=1
MDDNQQLKALLLLEDGSIFQGLGFGALGKTIGEVVFNTGMVGYLEALTDPSYYGQILTLTYPIVGNYGVPSYSFKDEWGFPKYFESENIKVRGLVIHSLCHNPSHWTSTRNLSSWLKSEGIQGIYGIDTRKLTKKLREKGTMLSLLLVYPEGEEVDEEKLLKELSGYRMPDEENLVKYVSVREPIEYNIGSWKKIALIDCGVKFNIIRCLLKRKVNVVRIPYNMKSDEILEFKPDGVLLSNGPGDPAKVVETIEATRELFAEGTPIFGICLGNQILALALGGETYKLKYGHRSQNQPCIDLRTGKCYITSQNHGYAVNPNIERLGFKIWFRNANDGTVEGLIHESKPVFSVQFHPEASPGPMDTEWLFDLFLKKIG